MPSLAKIASIKLITKYAIMTQESHTFSLLNIVLSLQVFQVPLEQCSQLTDCQSCTASPNPLCGWCTVEQKCSRQSQCQNSSETVRWVKDDAQCISSAITPAQFVLGIGQNVSILLHYSVST